MKDSVDMRLFARLLLEHVRAIMLLRNVPSRKEVLLKNLVVKREK